MLPLLSQGLLPLRCLASGSGAGAWASAGSRLASATFSATAADNESALKKALAEQIPVQQVGVCGCLHRDVDPERHRSQRTWRRRGAQVVSCSV